jgi:hypothetical protein
LNEPTAVSTCGSLYFPFLFFFFIFGFSQYYKCEITDNWIQKYIKYLEQTKYCTRQVSKYKSKYDRVSSVVGALVLPPPRCCHRPLCSPRVVGRVCEGVAWMAIASCDRRLGGGGVAKEAPKPDGTAPLRWVPTESLSPMCRPPLRWLPVESRSPTCRTLLRSVPVESPRPTRPPAPPPPPTLPPPTPRLHVVPSRGSPPSSHTAAPASAGSRVGLPTAVKKLLISSAVPPNKSANRNSIVGVSPWS